MSEEGPILLRSVLFTPADRPERVEKAWLGGAAHCVVADLEDAVAPAKKASARQEVVDLLRRVPGAPCERAVRINAWPGPGEADLDAVVVLGPDLIVVPKAEDPAVIEALDVRMARLEQEAGLPVGRVRLLLVVETARGVLRCEALAAFSRVAALAFGAEDLAADAGMRRSAGNAEVAVPRAMVALAAAAAGCQAIDMITADYQDLERTRWEAQEARGLGYAGKMCLHPVQVDVVHEAFRPTQEELAWARRVAQAVAAADAAEGGVVVVDGRMVDVPLVRQARRILADGGP